MGNVLASTSSQPPPGGSLPMPPCEPQEKTESSNADNSTHNPGTMEDLHKKSKEPCPCTPPPPQPPFGFAPISSQNPLQENLTSRNPGTMDDLNKSTKDLMPVNFEGSKVIVNKALSNHFQVSHTINMSSTTPSGYRFGAMYVGTKHMAPNEAFPVLLGDIDPSGNLNANVLHAFGSRLYTKFQAQLPGGGTTPPIIQLTADYRGNDYTASVTIANPNIVNNTGVLVSHYLQQVTPSIALGAELAYQRSPHAPGGHVAILSLAGRHTGSDCTISGTIGAAGLLFCYYQKASEQLQIGVELDTRFRLQESVATIGYQLDLPKADLVFKGMINSDWTVGATLEKKLAPLPFSLTISGLMNHSKNQFRLGLGFVVG